MASLESWALPKLSSLLPLDEESLEQIITYTDTLPKAAAAEHLKNLLGDSPQALEFITSFNTRRQTPPAGAQVRQQNTRQSEESEVPRAKPKKKRGSQFNRLPEPRRPENHGTATSAYIKKDVEDYMAGSSKAKKEAHMANTLALQEKPDAVQVSLPASGPVTRNSTPISKPPPSAAGPLISEIGVKPSSRSASPAPNAKTKVNVAGGMPMHGQSTAVNDLDSAIRALEIQTNPSMSFSAADNARRRCNCMATRHPLLDVAPNCLNCGKIICVKEGLGPCTFCEKPLLSASEIQSMVRVLREERGLAKMEANNLSQKRAEVSKAPRAFVNLAKPGNTSTPVSS
ncbi:hypothetical protein LTS18_012270, partial [Coniosporium uncinatum]